jgi:hypothetical protein
VLRCSAFDGGPPGCGVEVALDDRRRSPGLGDAHRVRLFDRLPTRAPTEVGGERLADALVVVGRHPLGVGALEAGHDPRRAEAALAAARGAQGVGPPLLHIGIEAVHRGDGPATDAPDRGHARDPRRAVDEHRAAAALTLRAAAVLGAARADLVAQHVEQRRRFGTHDMWFAVDGDLDGHAPPRRTLLHRRGAIDVGRWGRAMA